MQTDTSRSAREVVETLLVDKRERAKLFAYAVSRFGIRASDAEDLLQETALEMLRLRSYVRKPEAFVYTVFRARCARFLGGEKARRTAVSRVANVDRVADPMGAEAFNRQLALHEALASISSSCRRLLSAYYNEGQSLREAARRLSLAYSSVPKTISRCLKKLRKCLS